MSKKIIKWLAIIILIFFEVFILTSNISSAAIYPGYSFCTLQGYQGVTVWQGDYQGNPVERIFYSGSQTDYINFDGTLYKVSENGMLIDTPIENKIKAIKWEKESEYYCMFDDGNKCLIEEFYEGKCGSEYRKPIPCGQEGERIYSLQKCCDGLESFHRLIGGNICKKPTFFVRISEKIIYFYFWLLSFISGPI